MVILSETDKAHVTVFTRVFLRLSGGLGSFDDFRFVWWTTDHNIWVTFTFFKIFVKRVFIVLVFLLAQFR